MTTLSNSLDESMTAYVEWFVALCNKLFERTEFGELFLRREDLWAEARIHAPLDYAGLRLELSATVEDEHGRREAERSYLLRAGWTLDGTTDPDPLALLRELHERLGAEGRPT